MEVKIGSLCYYSLYRTSNEWYSSECRYLISNLAIFKHRILCNWLFLNTDARVPANAILFLSHLRGAPSGTNLGSATLICGHG